MAKEYKEVLDYELMIVKGGANKGAGAEYKRDCNSFARSGWPLGAADNASSTFDIAACKSSISCLRWYRFAKVSPRIPSCVARLGLFSGSVETASSAFETAACKSSVIPVQRYWFDSIATRVTSRSARFGWYPGVIETASSAFVMDACKSSTFPSR